LFLPLVTKKTTFFAEIFKIQGGQDPLPPLRRHVLRLFFGSVDSLQAGLILHLRACGDGICDTMDLKITTIKQTLCHGQMNVTTL